MVDEYLQADGMRGNTWSGETWKERVTSWHGTRTKSWRVELMDKRFTSTALETGIRKIISNKNKDMWPKQGYVYNNTKTNGIRFARKYEDKTDSE